jgi:hypothetical protein
VTTPRKACWHLEDVGKVIGNEALEGHEGVFLATHTTISGFDISGSHKADIADANEGAVLAALSDPERRHAFCVVQGEPGSGKSHLIRWLSVNWPHAKDVPLLLQRADGSLEGALRQLQQSLPAEFKELFENLGQRHRATPMGRANQFLGNLANSLDPEHYDPPLEDVDWCRANLPHQLVGHPLVRGVWKGPSRILRLLDGKGRDEEAERNSASASFDLFDIEALARCCTKIRGTGVRPATETLAQRLIHEAETIKQYRENEWTAEEIKNEPGLAVKTSIQLMNALNRRRNEAIQNLIGVSAEGLKTLFRQVRERLATRKERLILLLEDITSWEGIDDSLIDVLVVNADTRGGDGQRDMCPLISIVGVTPEYYEKLPGNYRGRITHELNLGKASHGNALGDVATLRDRNDRLGFTARYLSAVRAGEKSLNAWREKRRTNQKLEPPNPCTNCPERDGCHSVFGKQDGIGLFPLTADAFERMFLALNDNDKGLTWKTPRGILQAILNPNLSRPQALEDGEFPTALLETIALEPDSRRLSPRLTQIVDVSVAANEEPRMRRMLAYWGDRERADTTINNGIVSFAGVPRGVFDAFDLTWPGGQPSETTPPLVRSPEPIAPVQTAPSVGATPLPPTEELSPTVLGAPEPEPDVPKPPRLKAAKKSELENLRNQIRQWGETGELDSPTNWNKILHELTRQIEPRRVGLDPHTFERLLTPGRVKIEGTGPAQRNYFSVKPEEWVRLGFEAYIALRLDRMMGSQDAEFHNQSLAVMMRRLEAQVSEYADRRLTRLPGAARWTPVPVTIQILLARAWLRGVTTPDASMPLQLQALLSDEEDAESDPSSRCVPWVDFLNRTKNWHDKFRDAAREMLGTPQGAARNFGLADVSVAAGAILRLKTSLKFDPIPANSFETGVEEFDKARDLIRDTEGTLSKIVRTEREQIRGRADGLRGSLLGRSIQSHLKRIDDAVNLVAQSLPSAAPDRVKEWKTAFMRIKSRLDVEADSAVENLLVAFTESEGLPPRDPSQLGWLAKAPARDLDNFCGIARIGDQVVMTLLKPVEDCVREGRGMGSLEEIKRIGQMLRSATLGNASEKASV